MTSFFSFLNIIILLGTVQGIITSVLLFRIKINKKANKLLAWIILLISLACLNIYFIEAIELTITFWIILGSILPLVIIMPIGPLIYFYVKSILDPNFHLSKKNRPHFYTTILDFVPYIVSFILVVGVIMQWIDFKTVENWDSILYEYNKYIDIPRWISLMVYIFLTFRLIHNFKSIQKNNPLSLWSKNFVIGFAIFTIIWLIHLVPYIIPSLSNKLLNTVGWYPIYIPLIILVYWLGINGFIISFKYYKRKTITSKLSKKVVESTSRALENAMVQDRLFLNPALKLNDIVNHINVPQKIISSVLNQHLGKTFNEYVNEFRIEEFKTRLLHNNSQNLTITGIAFECGFNSQATFQRTFKAMTNSSPKEFQQMHLNS